MLSIFLLSLISCGVKKDSELPQVYTGYAASFIYAKAHQQMQNNDYFDAIRSYKSLVSQYPFTKLSERGMVELVYVYYMNDDTTMSLALGKQFIKMYPHSKYKGYVYYMIGVIAFEDGRGILQTYVPYDMNYHDPTSYENAYLNFSKAIKIDPKGNFVPDAKRRMVFINNTIAQHYYDVAYFYYKRGAYNAAIDRSFQVITDYPQSMVVKSALILVIKAYKKLGLYDQAQQNIIVFEKNYNDKKMLEELSTDDNILFNWYEKFFNWL